jgi:chorismate mutase
MDSDQIVELRKRLDEIDDEIIILIKRRRNTVRDIGHIKKQSNSEIVVPTEYRIRLSRFTSALGQLGEDIYQLLHKTAVEIQNEIY